VTSNIIAFVSTREEQSSLVSTFVNQLLPKSQYCEIHPATILGVCCSVIPFANSNQGPRNIYSSSMTKQAIGVFAMNFLQRFETSACVLHYCQKPLVVPRASKYFGYNDMPPGENAIAAIMCYTGFNQEDSVILNKGAVDRGMFVITVYKTYSAEEKNQENQTIEMIEAPIDQKGIDKTKNYLKLDKFGIIRKGSVVNENDVIIRKTVRRDGKNGERIDVSVCHKLEESGYVDRILKTKDRDGNLLVKVRVGFIRRPIIGDKFASVHAQKGTVGMILPHEDMPFTAEGIVPDIIINPHAIPSRMTIGHIIECVTGKASVMDGTQYDATPFSDDEASTLKHIEQIGTALHRHGFNSRGEEPMSSGMTGEMLEGTIFIGPTYYRRLKHMIMDKLSARSEGPVQGYTRQPANHGRKNGTRFTSIRVGTMETEALCSHGAAASVNERLFHCSDKYKAMTCNICGIIGGSCQCQGGHTMTSMPYTFKLATHNINALQIRTVIKTENSVKDSMVINS
jgi:DNA-directed RNA polymerase II subunit RPB2